MGVIVQTDLRKEFRRHFKYHIVTVDGVMFETNCQHEARMEQYRWKDARLWRSSPHVDEFPYPDICVDMVIPGPCPSCPVAVDCGCLEG